MATSFASRNLGIHTKNGKLGSEGLGHDSFGQTRLATPSRLAFVREGAAAASAVDVRAEDARELAVEPEVQGERHLGTIAVLDAIAGVAGVHEFEEKVVVEDPIREFASHATDLLQQPIALIPGEGELVPLFGNMIVALDLAVPFQRSEDQQEDRQREPGALQLFNAAEELLQVCGIGPIERAQDEHGLLLRIRKIGGDAIEATLSADVVVYLRGAIQRDACRHVADPGNAQRAVGVEHVVREQRGSRLEHLAANQRLAPAPLHAANLVSVSQRLESPEKLLVRKFAAVPFVAVVEAVTAEQIAPVGEVDDGTVVLAWLQLIMHERSLRMVSDRQCPSRDSKKWP